MDSGNKNKKTGETNKFMEGKTTAMKVKGGGGGADKETGETKFMEGKKTVKEVKGGAGGAVDEPAVVASFDDDGGRKKEQDLAVSERNGKERMKENEGVKDLPHQQVPQPGDFSTEALENL